MTSANEPRPQRRFSGILLHPTSLPGRSGIGDIGAPARRFVDFLASASQSLWQVCPLGPTGYGDSPYQSFSAFAGNPLLVALEPLAQSGYLDPDELDAYPRFPAGRVDYGPVIEAKSALLAKACERFRSGASAADRQAYDAFVESHAAWLDDFALYMALKNAHEGAVWSSWEKPLASRDPGALDKARVDLAEEIERVKITQHFFFSQWQELRELARSRRIRFIGDAPIFVAYDSADVWANPDLFYLDDDGKPTVVAGVPPDYFSPTGQLWGNPLYRWKRMKEDGYAWWISRLEALRELVDIVRVDHFRGFDAYWEVDAGAKTAEKGRWRRGPGADFFEKAREVLGELPLIAEDLGVITPRVDALREQFDLPGMKVLQFAFGAETDNLYLPHNHVPNGVVYTGTHDNDTAKGWYDKSDDRVCDHARRYLWSDGDNIHLDLVRAALMSVARYAVIPLQDLLGLGSETRLNTPGESQGNWQWRVADEQLTPGLAGTLSYLTSLYGRTPPAAPARRDEDWPDPDQAEEPPD